MNIAILITQTFDPEAGGVQRTSSKLYTIFNSYGHNCIIISFSENKLDRGNKKIYYIKEKQLRQYLYENDINILINQSGYSVKINKVIQNNLIPNLKVINTLRINPLNFYKNHKDTITRLLNENHLNILNIKLTYKVILFYHIYKQRKELSYILDNSDAFVMLSERFKEELYYLVPSVKKYDYKIHGISNPFTKPDIDVQKLDKEDIILYVGRLDINQKRVDYLLEIWKCLHYKLPEYEFWIVGDGSKREWMEEYCKKNNLYNVKFFGKKIPDKYYMKAKIFHMTSAFEGFGNVLIEAQSYGCVPILFNSYSAASEIIHNNQNGKLIEPFDINEYVKQTIELANNNELLISYREKAYTNSLRFSYEKIYHKWLKIFNYIHND